MSEQIKGVVLNGNGIPQNTIQCKDKRHKQPVGVNKNGVGRYVCPACGQITMTIGVAR